MTKGRLRFHGLVQAVVLAAGLCWAGNTEPACGQRVWGNGETLLLGPSAVVPLHSDPSPDPLNPAVSPRVRSGVEASLTIPLGTRELAVHRLAGGATIGTTSVSVMVGRLGFDRLTQHRLSVSAARSVPGISGHPLLAGVRGRLDAFSSPGRSTALETAITTGGLLQVSNAMELGLATTIRDAAVHGSRAIIVRGAFSIRMGRRARAVWGWKHSTALGSDMSTGLVLESQWGGSLTAGIGGRVRTAGISLAARTGGVRVVMAWVRTGPVGASRYVSAGLFRPHTDVASSE